VRIRSSNLLVKGLDSAELVDFVADALASDLGDPFGQPPDPGRNAAQALGRLLDCLAGKGLVTAAEVHYIARGFDGGDVTQFVDD
jgi:hypothetical protein